MAPIVLARGLADAVDAKIRSLRYKLDAPRAGWMDEVYVIAADGCPERREDGWLPLRAAVAAADERAHAAAKERARLGWDELPVYAKARVAYAFESEPWADDVLGEAMADGSARSAEVGFLLRNCRDVDVVGAYAKQPFGAHAVADAALELAVRMGPAAIELLDSVLPELLVKPKYGPLLKTPPREVVEAIGCFRTKAAARKLAAYAGHRALAPQVAAYFQEASGLVGVLEESGMAPAARKLAGALRAGQEARGDDTPEAPSEAVPELLRTRGWRARGPKPKRTVIEGVEVRIEEPERVELPERIPTASDHYEVRDMTAKELTDWRSRACKGKYCAVDYEYKRSPRGTRTVFARVPPEEGLEAWNQGFGHAECELELLATHGVACLPGFIGPDWTWIRYLDYEGAERLDVLSRSAELNEVADAASLLVRRKLEAWPPRMYDDLWRAALLLPRVQPDRVPPPPPSPTPLLYSLKPVFPWGPVRVPNAGFRHALLVVGDDTLCTLPSGSAQLQCSAIRFPPKAEGGIAMHLGAADPGVRPLVHNWLSSAWRVATAEPVGGQHTMSTFASTGGSVMVLDWESKGETGRTVLLRCPPTRSGAVGCDRQVLPWGWGVQLVDEHLVWVDDGDLNVAALGVARDRVGPSHNLGRVPQEEWLAESCRGPGGIALLVRFEETAYVALMSAGKWSQLHQVSGGHSLACGRHGAAVTGFAFDRQVMVVRTDCTSAGCTPQRLSLADVMQEHAPRGLGRSMPALHGPVPGVQALSQDDRLLLVWSHGKTGGLRMRLAPISQMDRTPDVVRSTQRRYTAPGT